MKGFQMVAPFSRQVKITNETQGKPMMFPTPAIAVAVLLATGYKAVGFINPATVLVRQGMLTFRAELPTKGEAEMMFATLSR